MASLACKRSLARLLDDDRELTANSTSARSLPWELAHGQDSDSPVLPFVAPAGDGLEGPADMGAWSFGCFCWFDCSSPSAPSASVSMLSSRVSTPATAEVRNEPHLDADDLPGAAIVLDAKPVRREVVVVVVLDDGCVLAVVYFGGRPRRGPWTRGKFGFARLDRDQRGGSRRRRRASHNNVACWLHRPSRCWAGRQLQNVSIES